MEESEVARIGKLSAGMTHELKNVFAIISESAGLMEDIINLGGDAAISRQDKISKALGKIRKHVQRGVALASAFNTFAHGMDAPFQWVDANELVELVAFLMKRFARQQQVDLVLDLPAASASVYTGPTRLGLALSACMDDLFTRLPDGGAIVLGLVAGADEVAFTLSVETEETAVADRLRCEGGLPVPGSTIRALGASLQAIEGQDRIGWQLILPRKVG